MLWLKAFHIMAVICWFAALFYLPRLFVYHAECNDKAGRERFEVMESKLYKVIATPSMLLSIFLGAGLLHMQWPYLQHTAWIWAKLFLVFILIGYHHICKAHMRRLADGSNTRSHVYFRIFNEVPIVLLIGIVILAVVKPF